jgi:lipopolysaccharide biosynthesis glycosyltransferase
MRKLVFTSIDDNFIWPWLVTIFSASQSSGVTGVQFRIANINSLLSQPNIEVILRFAKLLNIEVQVVDISTDLNPPMAANYSITILSRLILMDTIEQDFVWLDSDLLLLEGWTQIFDDLGSNQSPKVALYACKDLERTHSLLEKEGNAAYIRMGSNYINSGVLRIRPSRWREITDLQDWKSLITNANDYKFTHLDQDVLNYLCHDSISILSPKFNSIIGNHQEFISRPFIKHFAGSPKPWHLDRKGREFILASQGANYFRPQHRIIGLPDAYIDFILYWKVEDSMIAKIQSLDNDLAEILMKLKLRMIKSNSLSTRIKHAIIQAASMKFRPNWHELDS